MLSQIPGGASCDALIWKRGFGRSRNCYYRRSRVILAFSHSFIPVLCAELLHGVTAGIITAAVGAISLALVGRRTMSLRTGRNYQYAAGGHAVTAAMMGLPDAYYSPGAMFVSAGMLCVPALIALNFIRPEEIDYARARNAKTGQHTQKIDRALDLAKNRPLVLFAAAMTLFQLAEASTLPLNISRPRPDKDRCRSRSSSSFRRSWWRLFLHGEGITLKERTSAVPIDRICNRAGSHGLACVHR